MTKAHRDRDWLVPSAALTAALALIALAIMPNRSGVLPALSLLPLWLGVSAMLGAVIIYARLAIARVPDPIFHCVRQARERRTELGVIAVGVTLAGLNMCAFMWTKPLLNWFVPFWADPALAQFDRLLFLGIDPWRLLDWLNGVGTALFYHRGWFAMMIVTLLIVVSRPPSAQKSTTMLTYFLLWSVVGPLIHILLPAAGPVFYERMGYGSEFTGIRVPPQMTEMSDYLWQVYQGDQFGPGSGISAMPSMHIATTAWMIIAIRVHAPRLLVPFAALGLLIFGLSVSLGWHYAADGIVGAIAAWACYRLMLRYFIGEGTTTRPTVALEPGR